MEDSVNPCPPDDLDKDDTTLLRGDAIGDTAYTHRWVLRSLFTITQAIPKYLRSENQNSDSNKIEDKSEEFNVLELDPKVEDAACQLWDMTVEKSVTEHILHLEEVDIMQLAVLLFRESLSPRLTEIMIGIIANMCCQEKACRKILEVKENNELLLSTIHLLGGTSDVPTICEILRLMKLLLWYRTNRTSNTTWASCPLIKLLCQDICRCTFAFFINNSLSDQLISQLLELLSSFFFVCLPETGLSVASLFSVPEIIDGLLGILKRKAQVIDSNIGDDQIKIIRLINITLYAYIDTPGTRLIITEVQKVDSCFEANLLQCLEHEGHVESYEGLDEETTERLCHIISLFQLIIPHLKVATSLITIGRLLALISGQTHQYSVSRTFDGAETSKKSRSNSAEDYTFVENVESSLINRSTIKDRRHSSAASGKITTQRQFSNPPIDEAGWLSPLAVSYPVTDSPATQQEQPSKSNDKKESTNNLQLREEDAIDDASITDLKTNIEDYCYQLLAWYWAHPETEHKKKFQTEIFHILDQCHAHEVLFILKAVRSKDRRLVPRLQEQLLDSGSHNRLVALLAFMYQ